MSNISGNNLSRNLYAFGSRVESNTIDAFKGILKPISKFINPDFEKLQRDISRYDNFNNYLDNMYKDTGAKSINYQA